MTSMIAAVSSAVHFTACIGELQLRGSSLGASQPMLTLRHASSIRLLPVWETAMAGQQHARTCMSAERWRGPGRSRRGGRGSMVRGVSHNMAACAICSPASRVNALQLAVVASRMQGALCLILTSVS